MNKTTTQCIITILLPSCFALLGSDRWWERRRQEDLQGSLTTEKHTGWQRRYDARTQYSNHLISYMTYIYMYIQITDCSIITHWWPGTARHGPVLGTARKGTGPYGPRATGPCLHSPRACLTAQARPVGRFSCRAGPKGTRSNSASGRPMAQYMKNTKFNIEFNKA